MDIRQNTSLSANISVTLEGETMPRVIMELNANLDKGSNHCSMSSRIIDLTLYEANLEKVQADYLKFENLFKEQAIALGLVPSISL